MSDQVAVSFCVCGCGREISGNGTKTYAPGHKPKPVSTCFCGCGCGTPLYGSREYFKGHKPKKVKKTKEELSVAHTAQWKRWRERHPEKQLKPCACGCGEMVKGAWAWGHHSRVKNISKREDVKEKRRESFFRLHEEGKLASGWNRGLTKETDERVAQYGQTWSQNFPQELRDRNSSIMKESWETGKIVPLVGPDHPNWKGGTSSICQMLRGDRFLYENWKKPILQRDRFTCRHCNQGSMDVDLAVHHDVTRFAEILHECLSAFHGKNGTSTDVELTWEQKCEVRDAVRAYHIEKNVSGITLCYDCHGKVHETEKDED